MSARAAAAWQAIARRAREKDVRRRIRYDRARQTVVRAYLENAARERLPALLPAYLEQLVGAVLGFWIIAFLLRFLGAGQLYTCSALGLFFSAQTAYYGYRLARDPTFRVPRCRCAGAAADASDTVLRSRESSILRVPNAALGVVFYPAIVLLHRAGHGEAAILLALVAVAFSAYLAYVMVVRIRGLCTNCVNLAALNLLLLWQLLR